MHLAGLAEDRGGAPERFMAVNVSGTYHVLLAAQEAGVGRAVVVLVEECVQADVDLVQRGHGAQLVEAALAQGAPEALHLAACRGVVGFGVDERGAQPLAGQA